MMRIRVGLLVVVVGSVSVVQGPREAGARPPEGVGRGPKGKPVGEGGARAPEGVGRGLKAKAVGVEGGEPGGELEGVLKGCYAERLRLRPTVATDLGVHEYDELLEDYSPAGVGRERAVLVRCSQQLADLEARVGGALPPAKQIDLAVARLDLRSRLLEIEKVQRHRHLADFYPDLASESVYYLIQRAFAPEAERLLSVIARERRMPALLQQGQKNLTAVPAVSVELLRQQLPGIIEFFQSDVPRAFPTAAQGKLKADLDRATAGVVAALKAYGAFVDKKVAPKATAPYALGEALYREKLAADEMIETPLADLLAEGEGELKRLQGLFKQTAARISDKMPPAQVQKVMSSDYPPPDKLIQNLQARLAGLQYFLQQKKLVTLPSDVLPRVEETPPFLRGTTMASMFTPGPFETRSKDAIYNVTLPDKSWPRPRVADYMSGAFNRSLLDIVSIHEAFPGHYTQYLWLQRLDSTARKHVSTASYVEGWAHYAEQMMLDEGWGAGDDKLRLAQLQDALLRAARYVVGIRMHTRGMTIEQATAYFRDEGYQTQQVAEVEARRGAEDPTYLYYTWGKLRLLELREELRRRQGPAFSLLKFHDAVLAQGAIPLPLLRRALVP